MTNIPLSPTASELNELAKIQALQDMYGAPDSKEMKEVLKEVYIAKFNFTNDTPGYAGDLFLIQWGNFASEIPVTRLYRAEDGELVIMEDEEDTE